MARQRQRQRRRRPTILTLFAALGGLGILVAVLSRAGAPAARAPGQFVIRGATIVDPAGHIFVPHGANYAGPNYLWPRPAVAVAVASAQAWNFNMVRVNICLYSPCQSSPTFPNDTLDAIVAEFTRRGIVVMPELHDWTCSFPDDKGLEAATRWWEHVARRYRDNPYVWLNLFNEPGYTPGGVDPRWVQIHRRAIVAIRDTAGARNVIVVDGTQCGQDAGAFDARPVPRQGSAILSAGGQVKTFNGKTYANIVFDVHVYDQWAGGDAKLRDYLVRVRAAGNAVMIGETGNLAFQPEQFDGRGRPTTTRAVYAVYRVAPPLGVGILAWHFDPGDAFSLVARGDGYGCAIDDWRRPANLTWQGRLLWAYAHSFPSIDGVGRPDRAVGGAPCRDPVPPPDLLYSTSKMYAHSSALSFDTNNPAYFGDDNSRLVRSARASEWAIWALGGMTRFQAVGWSWPGEAMASFSFYVSGDNHRYTPLRSSIVRGLFPSCALSSYCWTKTVYDLALPRGTTYLKVVFPNLSAHAWTPQLGQVDYW